MRAELHCFTGATYQTPCPSNQWVNPQSLPPNSSQITIRPNDSLGTKRGDAKLSWNFILPQSWTAAGTIYLEAVILPPYGLQECAGCADAANRLRVSGVRFQTVPNFTDQVHFVRIRRQLGNRFAHPGPDGRARRLPATPLSGGRSDPAHRAGRHLDLERLR